jgi:hypothetical protein
VLSAVLQIVRIFCTEVSAEMFPFEFFLSSGKKFVLKKAIANNIPE